MGQLKNIKFKTVAAGRPPHTGWAKHNAHHRIGSQLDASTGKLTGDQQRLYADMPEEEWSGQPATRHKTLRNPDGSAEYQGLVSNGSVWVSLPNPNIYVTGVGR